MRFFKTRSGKYTLAILAYVISVAATTTVAMFCWVAYVKDDPSTYRSYTDFTEIQRLMSDCAQLSNENEEAKVREVKLIAVVKEGQSELKSHIDSDARLATRLDATIREFRGNVTKISADLRLDYPVSAITTQHDSR